MIVKCISNQAYIPNTDADGSISENQEMISVKVGGFYKVIQEEPGWYKILDESGEDFWYPSDMFEGHARQKS